MAAKYRYYLMGLVWVPLGVFAFFEVARAGGIWTLSQWVGFTISVLLSNVALFWYYKLSPYFDVLPHRNGRIGLGRSLTTAATALGAGILGIGCVYADCFWNTPISCTGGWLAALLLTWWWVGGRFRRHYAAMAAVVAGVSLLPLTGLVASYQLFVDTTVFNLTFGIAAVVGGIWDHVLLHKLTKPQRGIVE